MTQASNDGDLPEGAARRVGTGPVGRPLAILALVSVALVLHVVLSAAQPTHAVATAGDPARLDRPLIRDSLVAAALALALIDVIVFVAWLRAGGWGRTRGAARRRAKRPRPPWWVELGLLVMAPVLLVAVLFLVAKNAPLLDNLRAALGLAAATGTAGDAADDGGIMWSSVALMLTPMLAALGFVGLRYRHRRVPVRGDRPSTMAWAGSTGGSGRAELGLDDLVAEADPRQAVLRAFRVFENHGASLDLDDAPSDTPREFAHRYAERTGDHRRPPALTALFERARFSRHTIARRDRDEAIDLTRRMVRPTDHRDEP
jgi:Domain of unknown function (DUF4129)